MQLVFKFQLAPLRTGVPATIGNLTSLEQLYLSNNQITSVPAELGKCAALETLWLNDNQLTTIPAELGELISLVGLGTTFHNVVGRMVKNTSN
jgi:Leucine-rich repeat (LRR) protein